MDLFIRAVGAVSTALGVVSILLLLAGVLVVCQLVLVRYVFAQSAIWQHEFVTYALIAATFLGSPYVLMTRGHVNVDLVPLYLPRGPRFALALLAAGLGFAFCLLLAFWSFFFFREVWLSGETGSTIWAPPLWVPRLSMPVGFGLMCLQYVADILALVTGREAPFGIEEEL
ncbi:MAG: TRAP transporter small permease [Geminicoccaceae bacterium]|nr:TRAP transporter small permease [Geminicoccaceae bacterium]